MYKAVKNEWGKCGIKMKLLESLHFVQLFIISLLFLADMIYKKQMVTENIILKKTKIIK